MDQSHEIIKHALIRVKHHFMHACTRRESDKPQYSVYVSGPPCLGRIEQRCSFISTGYQANSSPPAFDLSHAGRWTSYILHCK